MWHLCVIFEIYDDKLLGRLPDSSKELKLQQDKICLSLCGCLCMFLSLSKKDIYCLTITS